jgi:hypothetical protein
MTAEALRFFQLGQVAAQESGCALTVAMLCANEAWTYAILGDARQMTNFLDRAVDELSRADRTTSAAWVRFVNDVGIAALTGQAYQALPYTQPAYVESARAVLAQLLTARDADIARSRTFDFTTLATVCLRDGDIDSGVRRDLPPTVGTVCHHLAHAAWSPQPQRGRRDRGTAPNLA